MRKILRRIAHARMAKAGLRRVNKPYMSGRSDFFMPTHRSYFALNWRDWAR